MLIIQASMLRQKKGRGSARSFFRRLPIPQTLQKLKILVARNKEQAPSVAKDFKQYKRDGLLTYIDQLKYSDFSYDPDSYISCTKVVNFDMIYKDVCRYSEQSKPTKFYQTVKNSARSFFRRLPILQTLQKLKILVARNEEQAPSVAQALVNYVFCKKEFCKQLRSSVCSKRSKQYERDGLLTYIDQLKYSDFSAHPDSYISCTKVVNFDMIYKDVCRYSEQSKPTKFYQTVKNSDVKKMPKGVKTTRLQLHVYVLTGPIYLLKSLYVILTLRISR